MKILKFLKIVLIVCLIVLENLRKKIKEFCDLLCLGYIKIYCLRLIKVFDAKELKWKEHKKSKNIIDLFNLKNSIFKMII